MPPTYTRIGRSLVIKMWGYRDAVREVKNCLGDRTRSLRCSDRNPESLSNTMFDIPKLEQLAMHRNLDTLQVSIRVRTEGSIDRGENPHQKKAIFIAGLEILEQDLVPGGTLSNIGVDQAWSPERGVRRGSVEFQAHNPSIDAAWLG
ncbi:hypothetical protein BKA66DRAFT_134035 [Pyrenochaeta sp. MPI-SDFR-AT-0127]|nr:hypothetical protein BKA66DRAFT_134035 [Pyrenochaeta sp. MPI-SDFR-AT-0127]